MLFKQNIVRQIGFDPFDAEALRERGLAPDGGLALYAQPPGTSFVAMLKVADRSAFETTLMDLLSARMGAQRGEEREIAGSKVQVAEARGRTAAAWTYTGDLVHVSAGPGCEERVAHGATIEQGNVDQELWFQRVPESVRSAHLFAWVQEDGLRRLANRHASAAKALALGLTAGDDLLAAELWAGVDAPRRNAFDPLRVSLDAERLLARLDPEAIAAGRLFADPGVAWDLLRVAGPPRHLEELSAQLTARGIRMERDLLPLFEGVFAVDAGLIGEPDLQSLRSLDPRRLNPFLYFKTAVLAPVKDADRAGELMPDVAEAVAAAVRGRLEVVQVGEHEAYEIHYRLGKGMTFGLAHGMLVVAGGEDAYAQAVERLGSEGAGLTSTIADPRTVETFSREGSVVALVHVNNLVSGVESLSSDSFGGGPTGMMLRSMARVFVGPVSRLSRVMVVLDPAEHGIGARLEIGFPPPEGTNG